MENPENARLFSQLEEQYPTGSFSNPISNFVDNVAATTSFLPAFAANYSQEYQAIQPYTDYDPDNLSVVGAATAKVSTEAGFQIVSEIVKKFGNIRKNWNPFEESSHENKVKLWEFPFAVVGVFKKIYEETPSSTIIIEDGGASVSKEVLSDPQKAKEYEAAVKAPPDNKPLTRTEESETSIKKLANTANWIAYFDPSSYIFFALSNEDRAKFAQQLRADYKAFMNPPEKHTYENIKNGKDVVVASKELQMTADILAISMGAFQLVAVGASVVAAGTAAAAAAPALAAGGAGYVILGVGRSALKAGVRTYIARMTGIGSKGIGAVGAATVAGEVGQGVKAAEGVVPGARAASDVVEQGVVKGTEPSVPKAGELSDANKVPSTPSDNTINVAWAHKDTGKLVSVGPVTDLLSKFNNIKQIAKQAIEDVKSVGKLSVKEAATILQVAKETVGKGLQDAFKPTHAALMAKLNPEILINFSKERYATALKIAGEATDQAKRVVDIVQTRLENSMGIGGCIPRARIIMHGGGAPCNIPIIDSIPNLNSVSDVVNIVTTKLEEPFKRKWLESILSKTQYATITDITKILILEDSGKVAIKYDGSTLRILDAVPKKITGEVYGSQLKSKVPSSPELFDSTGFKPAEFFTETINDCIQNGIFTAKQITDAIVNTTLDRTKVIGVNMSNVMKVLSDKSQYILGKNLKGESIKKNITEAIKNDEIDNARVDLNEQNLHYEQVKSANNVKRGNRKHGGTYASIIEEIEIFKQVRAVYNMIAVTTHDVILYIDFKPAHTFVDDIYRNFQQSTEGLFTKLGFVTRELYKTPSKNVPDSILGLKSTDYAIIETDCRAKYTKYGLPFPKVNPFSSVIEHCAGVIILDKCLFVLGILSKTIEITARTVNLVGTGFTKQVYTAVQHITTKLVNGVGNISNEITVINQILNTATKAVATSGLPAKEIFRQTFNNAYTSKTNPDFRIFLEVYNDFRNKKGMSKLTVDDIADIYSKRLETNTNNVCTPLQDILTKSDKDIIAYIKKEHDIDVSPEGVPWVRFGLKLMNYNFLIAANMPVDTRISFDFKSGKLDSVQGGGNNNMTGGGVLNDYPDNEYSEYLKKISLMTVIDLLFKKFNDAYEGKTTSSSSSSSSESAMTPLDYNEMDGLYKKVQTYMNNIKVEDFLPPIDKEKEQKALDLLTKSPFELYAALPEKDKNEKVSKNVTEIEEQLKIFSDFVKDIVPLPTPTIVTPTATPTPTPTATTSASSSSASTAPPQPVAPTPTPPPVNQYTIQADNIIKYTKHLLTFFSDKKNMKRLRDLLSDRKNDIFLSEYVRQFQGSSYTFISALGDDLNNFKDIITSNTFNRERTKKESISQLKGFWERFFTNIQSAYSQIVAEGELNTRKVVCWMDEHPSETMNDTPNVATPPPSSSSAPSSSSPTPTQSTEHYTAIQAQFKAINQLLVFPPSTSSSSDSSPRNPSGGRHKKSHKSKSKKKSKYQIQLYKSPYRQSGGVITSEQTAAVTAILPQQFKELKAKITRVRSSILNNLWRVNRQLTRDSSKSISLLGLLQGNTHYIPENRMALFKELVEDKLKAIEGEFSTKILRDSEGIFKNEAGFNEITEKDGVKMKVNYAFDSKHLLAIIPLLVLSEYSEVDDTFVEGIVKVLGTLMTCMGDWSINQASNESEEFISKILDTATSDIYEGKPIKTSLDEKLVPTSESDIYNNRFYHAIMNIRLELNRKLETGTSINNSITLLTIKILEYIYYLATGKIYTNNPILVHLTRGGGIDYSEPANQSVAGYLFRTIFSRLMKIQDKKEEEEEEEETAQEEATEAAEEKAEEHQEQAKEACTEVEMPEVVTSILNKIKDSKKEEVKALWRADEDLRPYKFLYSFKQWLKAKFNKNYVEDDYQYTNTKDLYEKFPELNSVKKNTRTVTRKNNRGTQEESKEAEQEFGNQFVGALSSAASSAVSSISEGLSSAASSAASSSPAASSALSSASQALASVTSSQPTPNLPNPEDYVKNIFNIINYYLDILEKIDTLVFDEITQNEIDAILTIYTGSDEIDDPIRQKIYKARDNIESILDTTILDVRRKAGDLTQTDKFLLEANGILHYIQYPSLNAYKDIFKPNIEFTAQTFYQEILRTYPIYNQYSKKTYSQTRTIQEEYIRKCSYILNSVIQDTYYYVINMERLKLSIQAIMDNSKSIKDEISKETRSVLAKQGNYQTNLNRLNKLRQEAHKKYSDDMRKRQEEQSGFTVKNTILVTGGIAIAGLAAFIASPLLLGVGAVGAAVTTVGVAGWSVALTSIGAGGTLALTSYGAAALAMGSVATGTASHFILNKSVSMLEDSVALQQYEDLQMDDTCKYDLTNLTVNNYLEVNTQKIKPINNINNSYMESVLYLLWSIPQFHTDTVIYNNMPKESFNQQLNTNEAYYYHYTKITQEQFKTIKTSKWIFWPNYAKSNVKTIQTGRLDFKEDDPVFKEIVEDQETTIRLLKTKTAIQRFFYNMGLDQNKGKQISLEKIRLCDGDVRDEYYLKNNVFNALQDATTESNNRDPIYLLDAALKAIKYTDIRDHTKAINTASYPISLDIFTVEVFNNPLPKIGSKIIQYSDIESPGNFATKLNKLYIVTDNGGTTLKLLNNNETSTLNKTEYTEKYKEIHDVESINTGKEMLRYLSIIYDPTKSVEEMIADKYGRVVMNKSYLFFLHLERSDYRKEIDGDKFNTMITISGSRYTLYTFISKEIDKKNEIQYKCVKNNNAPDTFKYGYIFAYIKNINKVNLSPQSIQNIYVAPPSIINKAKLLRNRKEQLNTAAQRVRDAKAAAEAEWAGEVAAKAVAEAAAEAEAKAAAEEAATAAAEAEAKAAAKAEAVAARKAREAARTAREAAWTAAVSTTAQREEDRNLEKRANKIGDFNAYATEAIRSQNKQKALIQKAISEGKPPHYYTERPFDGGGKTPHKTRRYKRYLHRSRKASPRK